MENKIKYNVITIAKTLDKLFGIGFNNDKSILAMTMEDLQKLPELTPADMNIIIELKKAVKTKQIIRFLSGCEDKDK